MPLAMSQLGTLLLVSAATGSYGAGGFCAGALAVANAVGAPFWGARADRLGQRRVVAFQSARRGRWPRRHPPRRRRRAPLGRGRGRERGRGTPPAADRSAGPRALAPDHGRHRVAPAPPRRRRLLLRGRGRRGLLRPRPGARRARRLGRQPDGCPGPRGRRPRGLRHVVRPARDRGRHARRDVEGDRRRRPPPDPGPRRPRAPRSCSSARSSARSRPARRSSRPRRAPPASPATSTPCSASAASSPVSPSRGCRHGSRCRRGCGGSRSACSPSRPRCSSSGR